MGRISSPLTISAQDRAVLEAMCTADDEQSIRARIILACEENKRNKDIAASLGVKSNTVSKWKEAYRSKGLDGIRVVHGSFRFQVQRYCNFMNKTSKNKEKAVHFRF